MINYFFFSIFFGIFDTQMECKRNGFIQSSIWKCCNGIQNSHKGFKWSYTKNEQPN